ncbi:MAG: hypothetical protein ACFFFT_08485, partial [Candidatus Thorarchaeota archaeon]
KSEANSGPFLILTEKRFSKLLESHCTNPGNKITLKFETSVISKILEVIVSDKKADMDTGAFTIVISCSFMGLTIFSIIS